MTKATILKHGGTTVFLCDEQPEIQSLDSGEYQVWKIAAVRRVCHVPRRGSPRMKIDRKNIEQWADAIDSKGNFPLPRMI